ncbi:hypothetical protein LNAOJCKE_4850 [Methylorubrum aminovorans]|uniref:Uncharacterized protein n=3 Tax=Methylorubrum TaxID=2282523 RepID=A0AA40S7N6_9HYPH|nr:hypothetical protein [Methylorubrum thiocyanatum]GJE67618.1 hypothetical protein LNAOJCKE_4850 [Methylorubrum aminovorans]GJE78437.1 hypothetical protein BGCPKDLD_5053 [Methylorubrum suomiense]GJE82231.1 hypothetical protein CJNNKLLH_3594 [Methylorubrum thiocyanatum]
MPYFINQKPYIINVKPYFAYDKPYIINLRAVLRQSRMASSH